jgi:carboxymethylenebutenolidase
MSRDRMLAVLSCCLIAAVAGAQEVGADLSHDHPMTADVASLGTSTDTLLPAGSADAAARLAASPRHREWVMIPAGGTDSVGAWIFYPERKTKAPVVLVIHEIFGVSTWVKGVGDQLAAQGFIAIVPDLMTGRRMSASPDSISVDSARKIISTLPVEEVQRRLLAAAEFAMHLPAAQPRYGVVGFCWGGSVSFAHAAFSPSVAASVVYYGATPDTTILVKVHAPVLGLYAGNDARVDVGVPIADSVLRAFGHTYTYSLFEGAGHGYLRDQAGSNGANMTAAQQAWPKTIAWFRLYLEK